MVDIVITFLWIFGPKSRSVNIRFSGRIWVLCRLLPKPGCWEIGFRQISLECIFLQYPKAIYANNHTGSIFTQNEVAMDNLFRALKKYNFIFVDSRTTAKSVAKKYAIKYGMPYIVRNTFLDNERNFKYRIHGFYSFTKIKRLSKKPFVKSR